MHAFHLGGHIDAEAIIVPTLHVVQWHVVSYENDKYDIVVMAN